MSTVVVTILLIVFVVVLVAVAIWRSVRIIPQATAGIVERFGRYHRTLNAGPNVVTPFVDRLRPLIDLREQVLSFPPQPIITRDNLVVGIDMVIYFQVTDPKAATYEVSNYLIAVEQLTVTTLRNVVGGMDMETALTSRDQINTELRQELDEATGKWGIRVGRVELKAIEPPASIQDSMEEESATLNAEGEPHAPVLNPRDDDRGMELNPYVFATEDGQAFRVTIERCFSDERIAGYFEQGVVTRKQVSQVLDNREIFYEATRLNSYQIYNDIREQRQRSSNLTGRLVRRTDLSMARQSWLDDSIENAIIPNIILAVNTILGSYQNKLIIEQDSEGLRRLQDPTFRVPTRTRQKLISLLSQMDGGSVAVAGPRGAGKSTLLKQFSQPLDSNIRSARTITVYVPAPSNYVARDFIAELFQRLCESYLSYCDYPLTEELYNIGSSRIGRRRAIHNVLRIFWLAIRVAITITLVMLVIWPLVTHKGFAAPSNFPFGHHLADGTVKLIGGWWGHYRAYFVLVILLVALEIWPSKRSWRIYLRRSREPELIKRAREYLLRLQIDKTVTRGTGVSAPNVRGLGFSMNKSSSLTYIPWSLPELVGYARRFMQDVSSTMKGANRPVVVAIDEIDRIGSLDDAEGFIGEIKAVFGVEGCYFLVAVAEDVGSLFAQRATAGRSILENAFDEIVAVGPLTLQEARSLLLKRVPGFTDAFLYFVHAMSGGLPRELIRITRRLVEINFEQLGLLENPKLENYPRLEDLSRDLVVETMVEVLDASRNQMSQLLLQSDWAPVFDYVRTASITLRRDRALPSKLYETITEIAELKLPDRMRNDDSSHVKTEADDYTAAARILNNLSAFAYFGVTVVDAFSDKYFDLTEAKRRTDTTADGAYEELAAARIELSVSYASARLILDRFRASLQSALTNI